MCLYFEEQCYLNIPPYVRFNFELAHFCSKLPVCETPQSVCYQIVIKKSNNEIFRCKHYRVCSAYTIAKIPDRKWQSRCTNKTVKTLIYSFQQSPSYAWATNFFFLLFVFHLLVFQCGTAHALHLAEHGDTIFFLCCCWFSLLAFFTHLFSFQALGVYRNVCVQKMIIYFWLFIIYLILHTKNARKKRKNVCGKSMFCCSECRKGNLRLYEFLAPRLSPPLSSTTEFLMVN